MIRGCLSFLRRFRHFSATTKGPKERTALPIGLASATALPGWEGVGARPRRQRSHVRIVSGAPEKGVPGVPGLWRVDFLERMAPMRFILPAGSSRRANE